MRGREDLIRAFVQLGVISLASAFAAACSSGGGNASGSSGGVPASQADGSSNQCLAMVNGAVTTDTNYPAVVHLIRDTGNGQWSSCTGTFISPTAVITAGHCTGASGNKISIINGAITADLSSLSATQIVAKVGGVSGTSLFNLGYTDEDSTDKSGNWTPSINDAAILLFPAGHAPAVMSIARDRPPSGARITMLGYGDSTFQNSTQNYSYERRIGTNVVIDTPSDDPQDSTIIEVGGETATASAAAGGTAAIGTFGDSGGPMIVNNQIAATFRSQTWHGVNGGTTGPNTYYNQYIDINSPQLQRLISSANTMGKAQIPPPSAAPSGNNSGGSGGCSTH